MIGEQINCELRDAFKLWVNQSNLEVDIPVKRVGKNDTSWSLNVMGYKGNTIWWKYPKLTKILRVDINITSWWKHALLRKIDGRSNKNMKNL